MLYEITQKIGTEIVKNETVNMVVAADAIENWSTKFSSKKRTQYGLRITRDYVKALTMEERGVFRQPYVGKLREEFAIKRVA
jgi:hypothetical protein